MEKRNINTIGMFDLFKGVGIILVVLGHTLVFYNIETMFSKTGSLVFQVLGNCLMPAFFLASGYGLRKRDVRKYIKSQLSIIGPMYVKTAAATTVVFFLGRVIIGRGIVTSLKGSVKHALGFLFAFPDGGAVYLRMQGYDCGPLWYVIAMVVGSCFIVWIMNVLDERKAWIGVGIVTIMGCFLYPLKNVIPFCIPLGMASSCTVFAGYTIKKKKLFFKRLPWQIWAATIGCLMLQFLTGNRGPAWFFCLTNFVLTGTFVGIVLQYVFIRMEKYENGVIHVISTVGKDSFLFLCIHTVELIGLPWWSFTELWHEQKVMGIIVTFAMHMIIITASYLLIRNRRQIGEKIGVLKPEEYV